MEEIRLQQLQEKLKSLIDALVDTYQYSVKHTSKDEIRRRLAEAIYVALGGKRVVILNWKGETRIPSEHLTPEQFTKSTSGKISGEDWSLEILGENPLAIECRQFVQASLADAIRQLEKFSSSVDIRPWLSWLEEEGQIKSEGISHAEQVLARLRMKFKPLEPWRVFFVIYRSDWKAFYHDRDIIDRIKLPNQIPLEKSKKQISTCLQNRAVWEAICYWLGQRCDAAERHDIMKLLRELKNSNKLVLSLEEFRLFAKLMWNIVAMPRENTITWSVSKGDCPIIVEPKPFPQNLLQQLVYHVDSSLGIYDGPLVAVPISVLGQPRLVVFFALNNPEEFLLSNFLRDSWQADIIDAFQAEFLASIQKYILAQPKANVWEIVIQQLPLLINFRRAVLFDRESNQKKVFCVQNVNEYVWQLREVENGYGRELEELLNNSQNFGMKRVDDNTTLIKLTARGSPLVIELEAAEYQVKLHFIAICHLVQEGVELGYRQQEQTKRLISFSTHDLNLFVDDLKYWTNQGRQMIPSDPSALNENSLEFASGAMIHTGWIPLQIWRDTVGYLLEGESKYPNAYNYDFSNLLNWMYHTSKARKGTPRDFQQQGIQESASQIPAHIKPLFQIAVYNMAHNALKYADNKVEINARLNGQEVRIQCSNDALPEQKKELQELEEHIKLIKGGEEFAFERLAKSGLRGWAMMAQNRLGARGWEFQTQIDQNSSQDNHIQVTMSIILKWEEVRNHEICSPYRR